MDNLRRFFLTASVIIFFALCIGGFITALNYDPKEVQLEPGNPTPLPPAGDIYDPDKYALEDMYKDNVLFILTPKENNTAIDFVISKYNPLTQDLSFLIIPDDLKVVDHENKNNICTLGEYFARHDGNAVADYLTSLLQIEIGGHCTFTFKDLTSLIKELGSLKCTLPYGIRYISSDDNNISYSTGINYAKGSVTLNGDSTLNLIKFIEDDFAALDGEIVDYYDDYYDDINSVKVHSAMSDDFLCLILQSFVDKFTPDYQEKITECFERFTETYDTSITPKMLEGMTYNLGQVDKSSVKFYRLSGTPQYNSDFYITYDEQIVDFKTGAASSAEEILSASFS